MTMANWIDVGAAGFVLVLVLVCAYMLRQHRAWVARSSMQHRLQVTADVKAVLDERMGAYVHGVKREGDAQTERINKHMQDVFHVERKACEDWAQQVRDRILDSVNEAHQIQLAKEESKREAMAKADEQPEKIFLPTKLGEA